jgi:hypothetical protein
MTEDTLPSPPPASGARVQRGANVLVAQYIRELAATARDGDGRRGSSAGGGSQELDQLGRLR